MKLCTLFTDLRLVSSWLSSSFENSFVHSFSLSEWTLDTWLTWLQTHICQCQFVGQLLEAVVVSFVHDFDVDAAIHQWK